MTFATNLSRVPKISTKLHQNAALQAPVSRSHRRELHDGLALASVTFQPASAAPTLWAPWLRLLSAWRLHPPVPGPGWPFFRMALMAAPPPLHHLRGSWSLSKPLLLVSFSALPIRRKNIKPIFCVQVYHSI